MILRIFFVTFLISTSVAQEVPGPLIAAEKARGVLTGGLGVEWTVDVSSNTGKTAQFVCISQGGNVYAVIQQPEDAAGNKYIATSDGKMWFWKPSLSRAVAVSKRQRLSGDAAIGDIASNSFVQGYEVVATESVSGATIYTLEAASRSVTYPKIRYWVSDKNLGEKAEFFAASGNLIRTATMEYGNRVDGKPFLSMMSIDEPSRTVVLKFSKVSLGQFPSDLFQVENLSPEGDGKTGPRKLR